MTDPFPTAGHLPYGTPATSGWSGSATSKARAVTADTTGLTSKRQGLVLAYLDMQGMTGATWSEVAGWLDVGHGSASGVLSNLHHGGYIARLSEVRNRCKVYVLPECVGGRTTEAHGRQSRLQTILDSVADLHEPVELGDTGIMLCLHCCTLDGHQRIDCQANHDHTTASCDTAALLPVTNRDVHGQPRFGGTG